MSSLMGIAIAEKMFRIFSCEDRDAWRCKSNAKFLNVTYQTLQGVLLNMSRLWTHCSLPKLALQCTAGLSLFFSVKQLWWDFTYICIGHGYGVCY
jgi:hypothetical protein